MAEALVGPGEHWASRTSSGRRVLRAGRPADNRKERAMPYLRRLVHCPALEKTPALTSLVEERVRGFGARGIRGSLARQLFGGDGPALIVSIRYPNLAELQAGLRSTDADPQFHAFLAEVMSLVRKP